jgi:hypothetical protein
MVLERTRDCKCAKTLSLRAGTPLVEPSLCERIAEEWVVLSKNTACIDAWMKGEERKGEGFVEMSFKCSQTIPYLYL